ncbi:hypothetical protein LO762_11190 [Actinocorallia sp. API 0066]|uniref:amidase n=1 Tax=Actinocorallia sp. API 0066 TaxID=2896846 RepID=UPI001E4CC79B|nr:amidase [Actinocorallia sp. API 0066]MCD0449750.1 hypothetical protein [Actinocorallia sp. API 0066]
MELWQLPATRLAAGIRDREFSATEVARASLDRIAAVNPTVNALVELRPEETLAEAARADAAVAAGAPLGPLHGVPVSTKINTAEKGKLASQGLSALVNQYAPGDEGCISALRAAGPVFLGRSNAPAFSMRWFSTNDPHGRTLNPYDAARTPGGSSGGAAAGVATGMTPIAQGNDIGGSIRYPAACCGVVGVRPTVGLVSNWMPPLDIELEGPLTFQTWAVQGPLARTVEDARLALHAMVSPDLRDPFGIPAAPPSTAGRPPAKVKVVRDVGLAKSLPAMDAGVDRAAAWLAEAGHQVEEIDLPLLGEAARLWSLLLFEDMRPMLPQMRAMGDEATRRGLVHCYEAAAELWGAEPGVTAYIQGWARRATLITRLQELLGDDTVLLTPASAEPAFEQDADYLDGARARSLFAAQWPMIAVPVLGFPAVSVPTGQDTGLPIGVQLIGGRFTEDLLLDTAAAIEAHSGFGTPIDPR